MLLDVGMIGPKGVGKTSLLAAMYHEINPLLRQSNLKLVPADRTGQTQRYLDEAQADLQHIAGGLYDVPPGVPNTDDVRTCQFALKDAVTDREYARVRWTDYPGEWLFPPSASLDVMTAERQELRKRLHRSSSVLVAIDTPALMWPDRALNLNGRVNKPVQVHTVLNEWRRARGRKDLVIFCPLKCEKWVQTAAGRNEVKQAVRHGYRDAVEELLALDKAPAVFYMPVQTVGSLHHQTYRLDGDVPVAVFRGAPGARYQPRWVENPLKAVLVQASETVLRRQPLLLWPSGRRRRLKRQRDAWLHRPFDESVSRWR